MSNEKPTGVLTIEGEAYTLKFDLNAMCDIEAALDESWGVIAKRIGEPDSLRVTDVRAMLFGALRVHHPETTLKDAGGLMDKAGGLPAVLPVLVDVIVRDLPAVNGVAA